MYPFSFVLTRLSDLQRMCSLRASCSWRAPLTLPHLHSSIRRSRLMQSRTSLPRLLRGGAARFLPSPASLLPLDRYDTSPVKLVWTLTPQIRVGIRFAETRLSDLISQNDCQALELKGYGKNLITSHGFSPDAFVQMAFQAAYLGRHGKSSVLQSLTKLIVDFVLTRMDRVHMSLR